MDVARGRLTDHASLVIPPATENRALIVSVPHQSLAIQLAVFAAERARLNGTVETISPPTDGQLSSRF